ncbi:hypothetical protein PVAP13_1NG158676 [Panicum virgatum]|uniref:Uncharacterized protein n=1 Tax=Panicum virgatum TaxID=38727 RepID=A0A8T0X453_PANVG|nr:hypothetical protein PVAP13_1NG158676 [Panicum virgatum]
MGMQPGTKLALTTIVQLVASCFILPCYYQQCSNANTCMFNYTRPRKLNTPQTARMTTSSTDGHNIDGGHSPSHHPSDPDASDLIQTLNTLSNRLCELLHQHCGNKVYLPPYFLLLASPARGGSNGAPPQEFSTMNEEEEKEKEEEEKVRREEEEGKISPPRLRF